jgi:hypothetical protein
MEKLDKIKAFEKELVYIVNPLIKEFTEKSIANLPDYFFEVPASSNGKYHPNYASGTGGLVRHTRSAVRIAMELMKMNEYKFTGDEQDLIVASLILHDGRKHGLGAKYSQTDHPTIQAFALKNDKEINSILSKEYFQIVCDSISSHMGQWNKDSYSNQEILPVPKSRIEKFVHLCDYIASRKCLEMNFDIPISR